MALFRGEVYFPVFTLTLFDKNSIKGHWNLIWLNLGSCNKGFIMIQRKQLSDTPTSPKSAGRQCQGIWISKGAEQMNRAFNKTVAFAFFFLVYSLNPLEFQIMQQRTKGTLKNQQNLLFDCLHRLRYDPRTVLNILDLVWPLLRYSELEW